MNELVWIESSRGRLHQNSLRAILVLYDDSVNKEKKKMELMLITNTNKSLFLVSINAKNIYFLDL